MWLLLGAGVLVAVLAGFLEYAHLASHHFLKNLPGKLGAEISREANGFTYSQSNGKRTLYTIHAAKFVQRKNNVVTLRDVGVVLYDTDGRADRIFGKEFEFDQASGVLRASGEVFLDLAVPAPGSAKDRAAYAVGRSAGTSDQTEEESAADPQAVHVRTSGVVFRQKEGIATTDEKVEFRFRDAKGTAIGAEFRSETGMTVLRSQVEAEAVRNGKPVHLAASYAELDREAQEVRLDRPETTGTDARGNPVFGSADRATVRLRTPARPEEIVAIGSVVLRGRGAVVRAQRGDLLLGERDEPRSADLAGGVHYVVDQETRHLEGEAEETHASFAAAGTLEHVRMVGNASARERDSGGDRTLTASAMDLLFAQAPGTRTAQHRVWLQQATATGKAQMVARQPVPALSGRLRTSLLAANTLVAHLRQVSRREEIESVDGTGHTQVKRAGADGAEMESAGDQLHSTFSPAETPGSEQTIATAEQMGHVHLEQSTAPDAGKQSSVSRGTANRATYVAATDLATLDGEVQLMQEAGLLWADEVTMKQGSGDATASGKVRASYRAGTNGNPVQVLAVRAEMQHDAGVTTFFGDRARPARMWQGGSSVEATVIEVAQAEQTLRAHGARGTDDAGAVRTVLSQVPSDGPATSGNQGKPSQPVTRIVSRTLVYTGDTRQALFAGGVQVDGGDLRLRGEQATAFLQPAKSVASTAAVPRSPFPGSGSLDRIVTTGAVHVDSTGRHATGDRLVYTAADRVSVLTGSAGKPPVVTDPENGTLSGAEIRFTPGDNGESTVVVRGGGTSQPKMRRDTRAR